MQNCPVFPELARTSQLEGFTGSCTAGQSGSNVAPSVPSYEDARNKNIHSWSDNFSGLLGKYLNAYSSALNNPGELTSAKVDTAKSQLYDSMKKLDDQNTAMQKKIQAQQGLVNVKANSIRAKAQIVDQQSNKVQERNVILSSRKRQVELGVQKNRYKRNVMYFLIFVNIIVLMILFYIIRR